MIVTLLWLTVSIPFVNSVQEKQRASIEKSGSTEKNNNPFSSTTEEKSESGVSMLSEYLHEVLHEEHAYVLIRNSFKTHPADIYLSFHPELLSPPPEGYAS